MRQRLKAPPPHPRQYVTERRITTQVRTHHQRVDEAAHEIVQTLIRTTRHRRTDRDIRTRTEPRQQHRKRRLQHHEHRHTLSPRQLHQPGVHLGRHLKRHAVAAVGGDGGAGAVEGERQFLRRTGQGPAPVFDLTGDDAVRVVLFTQQLPLPQRVVGVLHAQRRPVRRPTRTPCGIGGGEVACQWCQRPAVAGDVVGHQHQAVLVRAGVQEPCLEGHVVREVEGVPGPLPYRLRDLVGSGADEVDGLQLPLQLSDRYDVLVRLTVRCGEDGAQRLMPAEYVTQCGGEGVVVEASGELEHAGCVVGGALAFELAQEPQPALREGQRYPLRAYVGGREGGTARGAVLVGGEVGGDAGRGRGGEQRPDLHFGAEQHADAGDQADGEERMPAEGEEVVVHADRVRTEHLGEGGAQDLFAGVCGSPAGPAGAGGLVRGGQRLAVQLAVDGERKGFEQHQRGGHHVAGEPLLEVCAHIADELVGGVATGPVRPRTRGPRGFGPAVDDRVRADGVDHLQSGSGDVRGGVVPDLEAAVAQHGDDVGEPAVDVVHLGDDLADEGPVLLLDAAQDLQFALLRVDLQQVDRRDAVLADEVGEAAQFHLDLFAA
ncbi:putative KtzH [Streptomyces viridochromogenes Tue57]|uniref:Putative KtzH n=1 Tax=Streptomyces viridochromogenes Tue57 TaxID=1160705 RepID=L8P4P3_STRVR|nr:putative KtzH [Streptomyces viridochromogenes Tue57]